MNKVLELLEELRPDVDFTTSKDFTRDYLLDSFDIMTLTDELEEKYNIKIKSEDIVPENYKSVESIVALVRKGGGTVC